jgi:Cys-rich repeat protein
LSENEQMKTRRNYGRWSLGLAAALGASAVSHAASADQVERFAATLRGNAVAFGSTMGFDCAGGLPAGAECVPEAVTGTDTSPDLYFSDGSASALVAGADARTSVAVALPAGVTVERAFLYWGARNATTDDTVSLQKAGDGPSTVQALPADIKQVDDFYQAVADVTAAVGAQLAGAPGQWRVTGIDAAQAPLTTEDVLFSGWSLVVVYRDAAAPVSRIRVLDGLDRLAANATLDVSLTNGVPLVATPAGTLTVLGYDGDFEVTGDSVSWDGTPLTDPQNPANDFFNSTRSSLGAPVADPADVPQLPGTPDSMASYDLDTVDLATVLTAGDGAATLTVAAGDDEILVGALITQTVGCIDDATCGGGAVCDEATGSCATTCTSNDDCEAPTPVCDVAGGICVGCLADTDCPEGATCNTELNVCEGGGTGGAGGAGGGGSASGGAGVGGTGTGATGTGSGDSTSGGNDFSGLAAEGGGCSLSPGGSAKQTALLLGVFAAAAGLLARRRRRS